MKKQLLIVIIGLISMESYSQKASSQSPEWTKNLIIYEIATKGFTSPNGHESGTFNSLKDKIPYLRELGINGVWLTGHHLCESRFFYHCWNEYAVLRPDSIDPSLGSEKDFKALISEFHKNGIRVFLDVITHGVMNNSSLITQHPRWFKGGTWGMTDYDWPGSHPDLDAWWVDMYTRYVTRFGVDGYRLDVNIYRPDLWKKIKENCLKSRHPIAVWCESNVYSDGSCDFFQRQSTLSIQTSGIDPDNLLVKNVPVYFSDWSNRNRSGLVQDHNPGNPAGSGLPDVQYYSVQLSSHDDGWDGFPKGSNPYVAEGSRCLFGYSFLFVPAIPIFFSGEEFNAEYKPLPNLAPDLFGKGKEGSGTWLYGSWIQWDQVKQKEHSDMLEDVQKMIRIRNENSDLLFAWKDNAMPDITTLEIEAETSIPVPYAIWNKNAAIIIAGNNSDQDMDYTVKIPMEKLGLDINKSYNVRDLWQGENRIVKGSDLVSLNLKISADHTRGGGIAVIRIEQ